ncbi:MAG: RDD family protein [Actinomycetota bacterium]
MAEQQYYVLSKSNNQSVGPMTETEVRQWVSQSLLTREDMVARVGDADWISINQSPFAPLMTTGSYPSANREMGRPNEYLQNYAPNNIALNAKPQADSSILLIRWVALMIDSLIAIPLMILAFIPLISIIGTPLLVGYFVSRDALMGNGQSIGKRAMGLRVEKSDGISFSWVDSFKRNIVYLLYLGLIVNTIPIYGWFVTIILMIPLSLIFLVETIMVIATGRRIGDNLGTTYVVKES